MDGYITFSSPLSNRRLSGIVGGRKALEGGYLGLPSSLEGTTTTTTTTGNRIGLPGTGSTLSGKGLISGVGEGGIVIQSD